MWEEENGEENWVILGTNILRSADASSFSFDMWSSVYVRQKKYKFGRNGLSSFGDMEC